jgi:hypothetical protein
MALPGWRIDRSRFFNKKPLLTEQGPLIQKAIYFFLAFLISFFSFAVFNAGFLVSFLTVFSFTILGLLIPDCSRRRR